VLTANLASPARLEVWYFPPGSQQEYWLQNKSIFETIHGTTETTPSDHCGTPSGLPPGGKGIFSALSATRV